MIDHQLAVEYVTLKAEIKELGRTVAQKRKRAKELESSLAEQMVDMRQEEVEVEGGQRIERLKSLKVAHAS